MKRKRTLITICVLLIIILSIVLTKCDGLKSEVESIPVDTVQVDTSYGDTISTNGYDAPPDTTKGKIILTVGNKPSVNGDVLITGNKDFYNTPTHRPFSLHSSGPFVNDLTEPNWFIQLQYEFKEDVFIGFHLNKEKFRPNKNRFGFAGPTDLGFSIGTSYDFFNVDWVSTNISVATGFTIGRPRFETPWWYSEYGTEHIYSNNISIGGYERIGVFTTLVARFDFHIENRINLFVAPTINYRFINDYDSNLGKQKTGEIYSLGLNIGVGLNFNYKDKRKQKPKLL